MKRGRSADDVADNCQTLNLTMFTRAHIVVVWPNKGWTVFDVPPSWFSLLEVSPIFRMD